MPQGALETQANNKRSMIKIVVSTILAVHGVVLGGLLFLGCKDEAPSSPEQFADSGLKNPDPIESTDDPFKNIGLPNTDEPVHIPGVTDTRQTNSNTLSPIPPIGNDRGFAVDPGFDRQNPGGDAGLPRGNQRTGTTPGGGFIPSDPVNPPALAATREPYIVLPGDNFTKIAKKHNVKVSDISRANPGVLSTKLQVGQRLNLPPDVSAVTPAVPEAGSQTSAKGTTYTVKSGDTLTRISKNFGVSVLALQKANGIKGSRINVGQKLVIPVPAN